MTVLLRPAAAEDATEMAHLINTAGEGLPARLWAMLAGPGEDPMAFGAARTAGTESDWSWQRATIAVIDGNVAGMIASYERAGEPTVIDGDTPPMLVPLIALENRAPLTRYINVLATVDRFRRRGVARALIGHAERNPGPNGMALIVSDGNADARAFYAALGYVEAARAPIVRGLWETENREWILLTKRP